VQTHCSLVASAPLDSRGVLTDATDDERLNTDAAFLLSPDLRGDVLSSVFSGLRVVTRAELRGAVQRCKRCES
jgi:hypothetical protein